MRYSFKDSYTSLFQSDLRRSVNRDSFVPGVRAAESSHDRKNSPVKKDVKRPYYPESNLSKPYPSSTSLGRGGSEEKRKLKNYDFGEAL